MTREEYFEYHKKMTEKMTEITRVKNADYTGAAGDDPFANFSRVDSLGVCTVEQGFMVRMLDKYMRINSFAQLGKLLVREESVEDTLLDLANYCLLFAGYLHSKRGEALCKKIKPIPRPEGESLQKSCEDLSRVLSVKKPMPRPSKWRLKKNLAR